MSIPKKTSRVDLAFAIVFWLIAAFSLWGAFNWADSSQDRVLGIALAAVAAVLGFVVIFVVPALDRRSSEGDRPTESYVLVIDDEEGGL